MADIYDVIVVGSGAGGLAAAAATSRGGARTLVLEAMPFIGGYLNPYVRKKFQFDTGLHYLGELGEGGSFRHRLIKLGVWDKVEFIEINPDCIGEYHFEDRVFCLPKGKERFSERVKKMFPEEEEAVDKLMQLLDDIAEAVSVGARGPSHPRFQELMPRLMEFMTKSYGQLIDEITNNKYLKYLFSLMSGEAGVPPDRASPFTATVLLHYLEGGYYPRGGSGALRDAFVEVIRENGGKLKVLTRVEKITRKGEIFKIYTNKGEFYAKKVISNADPKITFTKLLDDSINPPSLKEKAEKIKPSLGSFYAFLVTDLDLTKFGISDSNLIHTDTVDLNEAFEKWDEFKSFFITVPTLKDPDGGHAPEGLHTIEIIAMAPYEPFAKWADKPSMKRGEDYMQLKEQLGDRLLAKVEKYIPDLRKHLVFKDFATPVTNLYWVNAPYGGSYGPDQTPDQMGPGRFPIKTEVEGLFLCGAGTIAGGVAPAIASGEIAGKLALKS